MDTRVNCWAGPLGPFCHLQPALDACDFQVALKAQMWASAAA